MAFSSIVQIGCSAGLRSLGNGELLWRELTLNGAGHHRAEDLVVEEPDRDEVEPAATTVELDSRHDVKKPRIGVWAYPSSEVQMGVIGINQSLTIDDFGDGEHQTRVGSFHADSPTRA